MAVRWGEDGGGTRTDPWGGTRFQGSLWGGTGAVPTPEGENRPPRGHRPPAEAGQPSGGGGCRGPRLPLGFPPSPPPSWRWPRPARRGWCGAGRRTSCTAAGCGAGPAPPCTASRVPPGAVWGCCRARGRIPLTRLRAASVGWGAEGSARVPAEGGLSVNLCKVSVTVLCS